MATVPNKNIKPIVAVLASVCCIPGLGQILLGQTKKGITIWVAALVGALCCVVPGSVIIILSWIDAYKTAEAIAAGTPVEENEYRMPLLHKIISFVDKSATLKA